MWVSGNRQSCSTRWRDTPGTIDALPRDKAEKLYRYVRDRIGEAREKKREVKIAGGTRQDPLDALKMRFVNGEISKEEYEEKKAILEG